MHEYTMKAKRATKSTAQMSFRDDLARRKQLEIFMREDGHTELTPILREAVAFYCAARMFAGKDAVRMDRWRPKQVAVA